MKSVAFKIKEARKLRGVGFLWGWHPLLGQKIEVELIVEKGPFDIDVEEVRALVFKSFRRWHGWSTRYNYKELREGVKNAETVGEIIQLLGKF